MAEKQFTTIIGAGLVCSNTFRADYPENAVGLLHEEMHRLGRTE